MILLIGFFGILKDGGPFFTYTMLGLLAVIVVLFVRGLKRKEHYPKTISLIASLSWFTLAWSFLGHTFGWIKAFDTVEAAGELAPRFLAGGIKMAIVNPLIGIIIFLIARLLIIVLISLQKSESE